MKNTEKIIEKDIELDENIYFFNIVLRSLYEKYNNRNLIPKKIIKQLKKLVDDTDFYEKTLKKYKNFDILDDSLFLRTKIENKTSQRLVESKR